MIKVEPPEGAPSRRIGPFAARRSDGDPDASLHFWFYNVGKRSVVLDCRRRRQDRRARPRCIAGADIADHRRAAGANWPQLGLDLGAAGAQRPRLIVVSIDALRADGPWADYGQSDLVGLAPAGR